MLKHCVAVTLFSLASSLAFAADLCPNTVIPALGAAQQEYLSAAKELTLLSGCETQGSYLFYRKWYADHVPVKRSSSQALAILDRPFLAPLCLYWPFSNNEQELQTMDRSYRSSDRRGTQAGRVPAHGVSPQPGRAEMRGTQRATADSRVGTVSQSVCRPLKLHVAPVETPLVVLLEHHGADESGDRRVVGEDAHDIGTPLDLGIEPLERIGAVDLGPVRPREAS